MPHEITLEDGTKVQALLPEEVEAEKAKLEAAHATALEEAKSSASPNWQEVRPKLKQFENITKQFEDLNITMGEDGQITLPEQKSMEGALTKEEVEQMARQMADTQYFERYRDSQLRSLDEETRAKVLDKYSRLTSGDQIGSEEMVDAALKDAISLVNPELMNAPPAQQPPQTPSRTPQPIFGGAPREATTAPEFGKTDNGKELGKALFGDDFYANKQA